MWMYAAAPAAQFGAREMSNNLHDHRAVAEYDVSNFLMLNPRATGQERRAYRRRLGILRLANSTAFVLTS